MHSHMCARHGQFQETGKVSTTDLNKFVSFFLEEKNKYCKTTTSYDKNKGSVTTRNAVTLQFVPSSIANIDRLSIHPLILKENPIFER